MIAARPTFMEFFAGGGMARLGLADAFKCVFANDFDATKCEAYRANFGDLDLIQGDVTGLSATQLPATDLAWASFPCQDLSLAGGRAGMVGERSGAFWAFWDLMRALKAKRRAPPIIVIENVSGLLTSRGGADFAALAAAITGEGYRLGGLLLDAADFAPQSRVRLFLIAWDENRCAPPLYDSRYGDDPRLARAAAKLPPDVRGRWHSLSLPQPPEAPPLLEAIIERDPPETAWRSAADLSKLLGQMTPLHRARVDAARAEKGLRAGAVYRRIRGGEQRAEVRYDGLAGCVRTLKGGSSRQLLLISEGGDLRLRPLLPREAARLMGLPETYKLPKTVTAATNLCGDGVCVPVVEWLCRHVLAPMAAGQGADWKQALKKNHISAM